MQTSSVLRNYLQTPFFCFVSAIAAIGLLPAIAVAEEASDERLVEEIVVTATRRDSLLQDTAATVGVITAEQIDNFYVSDIVAIVGSLPGIDTSTVSKDRNGMTIRGIAMGGKAPPRSTLNLGAFIATYLDDTPFDAGLVNLKLVDIKRIEVLMGPQGALFGKSTLGGALRYITNEPVLGELSGNIRLGTSTYDSQGDSWGPEISAVLNVPLGDTAALRFVAYQYNSPGYMDINGHYWEPDANDEDTPGYRVKFRWDVADNIDINLMYMDQELTEGSVASTFGALGERRLVWPTAETWVIDEDNLQRQYKESMLSSEQALTLNVRVGFDTFDANLIYGTKDMFHDRFTDDWGVYGGVAGMSDQGGDGAIPSHEWTWKKTDTVELRLISTLEDSQWDWMVGFYDEQKDQLRNEIGWMDIPTEGHTMTLWGVTYTTDGELILDEYRTNDYEETSFYFEVGYQINDTTRVSGGMRLASNAVHRAVLDPVTRDFLQRPETADEDMVDTYKFVAQTDLRENLMVYAMVASGFRNGGMNLGGGLLTGGELQEFQEDIPYLSDSIWNYEGGLRGTFKDGRVQVNATLYRIFWQDMQLNIRLTGSDRNITTNIGGATITGIEVSTRMILNENWQLALNGSLKNPIASEEFTTTFGGGTTIKSGDNLPGSSKANFSVFVDYFRDLNNGRALDAHAGLRWVGTMNTGPLSNVEDSGGFSADAHAIMDLSVGVRTDNSWHAGFFVNNLFDNVEPVFGGKAGGAQFTWYTRPRMIGFRAGYDF